MVVQQFMDYQFEKFWWSEIACEIRTVQAQAHQYSSIPSLINWLTHVVFIIPLTKRGGSKNGLSENGIFILFFYFFISIFYFLFFIFYFLFFPIIFMFFHICITYYKCHVVMILLDPYPLIHVPLPCLKSTSLFCLVIICKYIIVCK